MNELEYLLEIFSPYVKFEKTEEQYRTIYEGNIDKGLRIEIVITYHIEPSISFTIEDASISLIYDKQLKNTQVVIVLRQRDYKYSSISFTMDTVKEILIETEAEFKKKILE